MERFVSIDCGKFATKAAEYDSKNKCVNTMIFRTRTSEGDFRDDALPKATCVVDIGDGNVYKVGNGALNDAVLETSKLSDTHRICTITALSLFMDDGDEVNVSVLLPTSEWANVSKREDYKEYILPNGEITVTIKRCATSPVETKTFTVKSKYVFAESSGALFVQDLFNGNAPEISPNTETGVIDIGNLNLNATLWNGTTCDLSKCITAELGGQILISGLAEKLSAKYSRVNEQMVAYALLKEDKCLDPINKSKEIIDGSRADISEYLKNYVLQIKNKLNTKQWSLDFMNIICIGGTCKILKEELKNQFGEGLYILDKPEFINVLGALRILCAKVLNETIPLTLASEIEKKENAA